MALTAFASENANTVKIGVILPLTGNMAQVGEPQLAAVELFKKECATGHYKHKYQIIVEDDAFTGRLTAEAANKFINVEHVDAMISFGSTAGNIIAPRARAAKIPHISAGTSDKKVADGIYNYINWAPPEREAVYLADTLQKMGGRRVAFLTARQQGLMAIEDAAERELKKRGYPFISNTFFIPGERDFRTTLLKIQKQRPDILIPLGFSPEEEIILRQKKQLGFEAKVTSVESFDLMDSFDDAEGLFYVSGSLGSGEFQEELLKTTGKKSYLGVPYTYESLNLIRAAYESQPTVDHAAAARWVSNVKDRPSALGPLSTSRDGRIDSPAAFFQIVHGKPTPVTLEQIK
jgi:branched-chain amino acid transport system substrate-binding protein